MAKLFKGNNSLDPSQVNIPTQEQNQAQFLDMKAQSQQLMDIQTQDMLAQKQLEQSPDIAAATGDPGQQTLEQMYGGLNTVNTNQEVAIEEPAPLGTDIHRSWASQFTESFAKGVGDTVIGSTGDVINLLTAPLHGFTLQEGNVLGRALREYGDEMANEHTTYLAKKLEGQELTWGSLLDADWWGTQGAEMLPMAIEFMVTGFGAGSAAKKGMGMFVRGASKGGWRRTIGGLVPFAGEATQTAVNTTKAMATGAKVAEDMLGSGKGLAKYLIRDVDGVLQMSKFSNEFVGAAGAGLANNLLAGATNAMDYQRVMKAENEASIAKGDGPKYTEEQMADVAAASMWQNMHYAPIDMISWGITYAGVGKKVLEGMGKKLAIKSSQQVAKDASITFRNVAVPFIKGAAKTAGLGTMEGIEETFQETYENWAQLKAKESVTGDKAPDYWDYYFSKENKDTRIASFGIGALMGSAMNMSFNDSANKGVDYMNRHEFLKSSIDAQDKGAQLAKTWHVRTMMLDMLHGKKEENFDAFMSDQMARGNVTPQEVEDFTKEFEDVQKDYDAASSLNIAGKHALMLNTINAKTLERFIANEEASYDEKVSVLKEQFGEEDESLLEEEDQTRLKELKQTAIDNPEVKTELDVLNQKIKARKESKVQKEYAKLKKEHEEQIRLLSINLAQANVNRQNLISGKTAEPLNIKFWVNANGNEVAYMPPTDIKEGEEFVRRKDTPTVSQRSEKGILMDPSQMDESQLDLVMEKGDIVAGISDLQYEKFIKMTDDEVYATAKSNHDEMLKKGGEAVKNAYDKIISGTKSLGAKIKAKLNPDGTPVEEENTEATTTEVEKKVEAKVDENLEKILIKDDGTEANAYTESYQEGGKEALSKNEQEAIAKQEELFRQQELGNVQYDENGDPIVSEDTSEAPTYSPVKNKADGKYYLVDTKTGEQHPDNKSFPTSISAKKAITEGNASVVGGAFNLAGKGFKLGFKGVKAGAKFGLKAGRTLFNMGKKVAEESTEETVAKYYDAKNAVIVKRNIDQDVMRREIMHRTFYTSPARSSVNNPLSPISKQELDAYLNTKIAEFHYGPTGIDQQTTINRMLKAKGINANVISTSNLFSAVGIPAVGYALASTIYINEDTWDQPEHFMHEMLHVNYRLTKDTKATKAVIAEARRDSKLVAKVERLYKNKIQYIREDGHKMSQERLFKYFIERETSPGIFMEQVKEVGVDVVLERFGYTKAPDEQQTIINEELFTNYLQGPMAKNFDHALNPIKERGRQKVSKNWWKVMKGEHITYEPFALDVVEKLNDGKAVPQSDLLEHILTNFEKSTKGNEKAFTSGGFASIVDMQEELNIEEHNAITESKIEQRRNYDPIAAKQASGKTMFERLAKKITASVELNMKDFSEQERQDQIDYQLEELENAMLEEGAFDDYESAKTVTFRGATRILNSFTRSLNYVRRKKFLESGAPAAQFDEDRLIDRDLLISEFFNLAFETKGDANKFISAIENSRVEEVWQFNQYMDKMHPDQKRMYLASMAYVMGNQQTISAIKSVVNSKGQWETHNALSETEKNKVDRHLEKLREQEKLNYKKKFDTNGAQMHQLFLDAYNKIKTGTQTNDDYLRILRYLAPKGLKMSALINNQSINMRGHNVGVRTLIDKMVKSKVMENQKKPGSLYVYQAKPFIEALVDSNRRFTSYSVIQNAEGNMEPSRITNNHLLSELNGMNEFLVKDSKGNFPTFKSFKAKYSHLSDPANRTHENPVLRSIYDNAKNGIMRPTTSQYVGLTHLQRGENSLYKNSTDFTQTIEDFMMFAKVPNSNNYMQTLSAMADSPRKFLMSVGRIKFDEVFKPRTATNPKLELTTKGRRMLERSWSIYDKSNENLEEWQKEKTIRTEEEFIRKFGESVNDEIKRWNLNAADLIANKTISPDYFVDGKLSRMGQDKIAEFVFNQSVNGMALAEIFNPGIPFNEIVKRNKGNSSPVNTFGNPNLKMEVIPINDSDKKTEKGTDGGMYMTRKMAQKIVDAGLGVFDLNNGLKLLNYHVERDNPNFKGMAAYFKGYTTIIDENTLVTEPGLAGVYRALTEREERYNSFHKKKYGTEPSLDLTNGEHNYINYAVPYSAIKSDFFSPEYKAAMDKVTFANIEEQENSTDFEAENLYDKINETLDGLFYGKDEKGEEKFIGLSTSNFGPQQIMDKVTTESTTPVQFISAVIVNGMVGENLAMGEEIQKLIRKDMDNNLDDIINELGDMSPAKYKTFILKNLDLENMDQSQRLVIEENLTNLNHPMIQEFITNTLANRLKQAGNKLKTSGTLAQQKPSIHYRYRDGIVVDGRKGLDKEYRPRHNEDGSIGSQIMEIVLPNHMKNRIKFRKYLTIDDPQVQRLIASRKGLQDAMSRAKIDDNYDAILKEVAIMIATQRHPIAENKNSYGNRIEDYIGKYTDKNGQESWFVRGESVIATRVPSHGPASTGAFEAIDYLEGEGNQAIVPENFTDAAGADYDGDTLFIQTKADNELKSKQKKQGKREGTPNYDKALQKTVELWTSPGMREQIKAKIEFKDIAQKVIGNNNKAKITMPMSPDYHRAAYNNTMISKRSIGIVFNTHRLANYLASYEVQMTEPINIDGHRVDAFKDKEVGQESRNNKSAMLANIILDNAKWGFADALGLNDQTINQYVLLINMGFSLQQVNDIMNSKAVKVWNKHQGNNQNPFFSKKKNADVKKAILDELGIDDKKVKNISINTNEKVINNPDQMKNIIQMMEMLEAMNADILHVSKIMAGHKGIENNPFILEQQLKDFNDVVDSTKEKPLLKFPEAFKNNPDIKAYHDNATKILEILKKANPIYNTNTSALIESLNKKIGFDDTMNKKQMERASDLIKRFQTSRILGLNNVTSAQKKAIREKVLRDVNKYTDKLEETRFPGGLTALDKSVLFNRALNIDIQYAPEQENILPAKKVFSEGSYVSANPRFFNESLTDADKRIVQEEWKALPEEIKDGLMVLDLMKNGLTGKLSLSNVFDEITNHDISTYASHESKTKNSPIEKKVMARLENLIISNEFKENKSILNATNKVKYQSGEDLMEYIKNNNDSLFKALKIGNGMIFKIDGKPYIFEGITDQERRALNSTYRGDHLAKSIALDGLIEDKINPYKVFPGEDINLEAISLASEVGRPTYKSRKATVSESTEFMEESTNGFTPKKKVATEGNASVIDYHNYNDVAPLNQREFNVAMEYDNTISDEQKTVVYKKYLADKREANDLTNKFNQTTYAKMSDSELKKAYSDFAKKDLYAYSILTTPLVMELANRMGTEQSNLTKTFENGKDVSVMNAWFNGNNISANHPVTQRLVRMIGEEYKKFVKTRGKYIQKINLVTDALYREKFGLSNNSFIAGAQKVIQSLFRNRANVYKELYGNLLSEETYKDDNGIEKKNFKFKTEEEIKALYHSKKISKAEFDFYNVFTETTKHLKSFDGNDKVRQGYIPHTSMGNFEMFANRGLLGLMVNSKGQDAVIEDVKIYVTDNGKEKLMSFRDIKTQFNALAASGKQTTSDLLAYNKLKNSAKKLQKTGKNEDGSNIIYSNMQNETLLGMSPMSRFESSRSMKAELMPSMDLNKALIDYVHSSIFTNGDGDFKGFKAIMPMIDGVMAYNDKNGYQNAYKYVKEVFKEGLIMNREQVTFGKNTDAVINGLVKGNTFYALGYKGLVVGKGLYAIGNLAVGKYMNMKREGGKSWAIGEARYWGVDKGISLDTLDRRQRARKILNNLGYMEANFYDDVNVESKTGLDSVFTKIALLPISSTEDWIQRSHMLGLLTDEEFNLFDENGDYKTGTTQIHPLRIAELEERVKNAHGKGFSPIDQSRMHKYAIGKMFMQFSRHIPTQIRERFAKEDVDMNGNKYIGSLRQIGKSASDIFHNGMHPEKVKEYYKSLEPHQQEALMSGLRGMALMTMLGFVAGNTDEGSKMIGSSTDASGIASGVMNDANIHFDPDKMVGKLTAPVIRSGMSIMKGFGNDGSQVQQ